MGPWSLSLSPQPLYGTGILLSHPIPPIWDSGPSPSPPHSLYGIGIPFPHPLYMGPWSLSLSPHPLYGAGVRLPHPPLHPTAPYPDPQLTADLEACDEAMAVLDEVIMSTFQQSVYYLTKVPPPPQKNTP